MYINRNTQFTLFGVQTQSDPDKLRILLDSVRPEQDAMNNLVFAIEARIAELVLLAGSPDKVDVAV